MDENRRSDGNKRAELLLMRGDKRISMSGVLTMEYGCFWIRRVPATSEVLSALSQVAHFEPFKLKGVPGYGDDMWALSDHSIYSDMGIGWMCNLRFKRVAVPAKPAPIKVEVNAPEDSKAFAEAVASSLLSPSYALDVLCELRKSRRSVTVNTKPPRFVPGQFVTADEAKEIERHNAALEAAKSSTWKDNMPRNTLSTLPPTLAEQTQTPVTPEPKYDTVQKSIKRPISIGDFVSLTIDSQLDSPRFGQPTIASAVDVALWMAGSLYNLGTAAYISSALHHLPGVRTVSAWDCSSFDWLEPGEVAIVVDGGQADEIAEVISKSTMCGIITRGTETSHRFDVRWFTPKSWEEAKAFWQGRQAEAAAKALAAASVPDQPADPLDVEYDEIKLRELLRRNSENNTGVLFYEITPAQRAAVSAHWSAQLRAKVAASEAARKAQAASVVNADEDLELANCRDVD